MPRAKVDWEATLIGPDASILDAIRVIDRGRVQLALVIDAERRLLGTVTDGDVRRSILKRTPLESPVRTIMNATPTTMARSAGRDAIIALMHARTLNQVPLVDEHGRVVGLEVVGNLLQAGSRENWVVLMAGGPGTRLRPLTEATPKPLLPVGDRPILETIVEGFVRSGFERIFMALNYKADMIREHFGDGRAFGARIDYLSENERLGTAGALSLLPERPPGAFFVMNADLLTSVNFQQLMTFHEEHDGPATVCVREYDMTVPYGVAEVEDGRLGAISEKPVQRFFVNAGIYVFDPDVLDHVPNNVYIDMTTFLGRLIELGLSPRVFPLREYWIDIGQKTDYERAKGDYPRLF